jgi:hypothetical protein
MKRASLAFTAIFLATSPSALFGNTFDLKVTDLGGGKIQVLATNIFAMNYCIFETSSNLVTWTPVVTNRVYKTWSTNTFLATNAMTFYRARVY